MNKYHYQITIKATVDAFEDGDAFDMVQEAFGIGETGAVTVTDCEYKEL